MDELKKITIEDYFYANIPTAYFSLDISLYVDKYLINKKSRDKFVKFVDACFHNGGTVVIVNGDGCIDRTAFGIMFIRYFRRRYKGCIYVNGSELYEYLKRYDSDSVLIDRLFDDDIIVIDDVVSELFRFAVFKGLFKSRNDRKLTSVLIFSSDEYEDCVKYLDSYFLMDLDKVNDDK